MSFKQLKVISISFLFAAFLIPSIAAAGRVKETRDVKGFSKVVFGCPGDMLVIQGDEEKLIIEADEDIIKDIVSEVRGRSLKITIERISIFQHRRFDDIKMTLYVKNIEEFMLSGSGNVESESLESDDMKLWVSGSGTIDVDRLKSSFVKLQISGSGEIMIDGLNCKEVDSSISGSGEIELSGRVERQDLTVSGSGEYKAEKLQSEIADISVCGSGDAIVCAEKELSVSVSGSGDVEYRGNPSVKSKVSGSGKVKKIGK